MFKNIILLLLFLLAIITVNAQQRTYFNEKGKQVSKSKATSYVVYKKTADTAWGMQKFNMLDTILESGTYKDSTLKIPNGQFLYYKKLQPFKLRTPFAMASEMDTLNHLTESGVYKNGLKNGEWTTYYPNGKPEFIKSYLNDTLNGRYKSYRYDSNTILMEGNYAKGLKEGEWRLFNAVGEVIQITIFSHSYISETHILSSTYKASQPSGEFYSFIEENVKKIASNRDYLDIIFRCRVTAQGKLEQPEITSTGIKESFRKQLLNIISSSPAWIPGTKGNPAQPIEDFATFVIKISNGEVTTQYLDVDAIRRNNEQKNF